MADLHLALLWMVPLAVALDLALRYPSLPHPVQWLGRWLDLIEPRLRALAPALERTEGFWPDVLCNGEVRAGLLGLALTVALAAAVTSACMALPFVGWLCALFLCWSGLALGQLLRAGREALAALERAEPSGKGVDNAAEHESHALEEARWLVGRLVSRDVSRADRRDLYRSLAETLAENFNDAFVAPLFWLALGGPVGLWVYKAVSTMDSMWGYRTERWENFGKTAARLDDALAFLPARLSAFLLWVTASLGAFSGTAGAEQSREEEGGRWPGVAVVRRQAALMASPNAGWPMAAVAWLHGAPMGGPTVYHGVVVNKPHLGPDNADLEKEGARQGQTEVWNADRVRSLLQHLFRAGIAGGVGALLLLWGIFWAC